VPGDKEYRFATTAGTRPLAELFDGRSQLIVRLGRGSPAR